MSYLKGQGTDVVNPDVVLKTSANTERVIKKTHTQQQSSTALTRMLIIIFPPKSYKVILEICSCLMITADNMREGGQLRSTESRRYSSKLIFMNHFSCFLFFVCVFSGRGKTALGSTLGLCPNSQAESLEARGFFPVSFSATRPSRVFKHERNILQVCVLGHLQRLLGLQKPSQKFAQAECGFGHHVRSIRDGIDVLRRTPTCEFGHSLGVVSLQASLLAALVAVWDAVFIHSRFLRLEANLVSFHGSNIY